MTSNHPSLTIIKKFLSKSATEFQQIIEIITRYKTRDRENTPKARPLLVKIIPEFHIYNVLNETGRTYRIDPTSGTTTIPT